jgi:hypothetical protein
MCIHMDDELFLVWDGTPCPSVWRYMVWGKNNRRIDLGIDPGSFKYRTQDITANGHLYRFLQGALQTK